MAEAVRTDAVELRGDVSRDGRLGGRSAAQPEEFPIVLHGEVLATLVVHPRPGEHALTPYDRALIERLALHSAPALHGARALAELTATHARLLLAREEERRRLRRDLHDDLSPTLSGLRLSAAALARRAQSVDADLAATAADLARDIQDAVEQTREIAYGLRPPVLDDRGLVAAIRDRVHGQSAADRVHVEIVAPDGPLALPAAVDLAALRIVQEAVANVRRHSGASRCTVVLERDPGELRVQVDDDGRGIPDRIRPGLGLRPSESAPENSAARQRSDDRMPVARASWCACRSTSPRPSRTRRRGGRLMRAVVVDDHPVFRKGLVALLEADGIDVAGEAENGLQAIDVVAAVLPDVVLMDLGLPELGGVEATERIVAEHPGIRVVVITLFDDEQSVRAALAAGASGYVVKQAPPEHIVAAVRAAADGALWLGAGVPRPSFGERRSADPSRRRPIAGLTPRESEIADLLGGALQTRPLRERLQPLGEDGRELRLDHPAQAGRR